MEAVYNAGAGYSKHVNHVNKNLKFGMEIHAGHSYNLIHVCIHVHVQKVWMLVGEGDTWNNEFEGNRSSPLAV